MVNRWIGCYKEGWQGIIDNEAFCHPAKFARGLIRRIYEHAKSNGWINPGDYVLDPFGGVSLGALDAMIQGLNWIGIELEEKFVKLSEKNIKIWNKQLQGWPELGTAKIVQGDSRNLKNILKQADIDVVVSSPPFYDCLESKDIEFQKVVRPGRTNQYSDYGNSVGQLSRMKEGSIDAVISSLPYENAVVGHGKEKDSDTLRRFRGFLSKSKEKLTPGRAKGIKTMVEGYNSQSANNLGNLSNDTFWSASKIIVQHCYDLLKPGGHAIWVTKDYIKSGKKVPFTDRWIALCEHIGFKLICRHYAMLIETYGVQMTITGEEKEIVTERKSFFRRLAEKKGSPRIDWEDVICFEKL